MARRSCGGIEAKIETILRENKISARVESRIKRLYSIQQKLTVQQIPVEQVYDLFAIRVICQTVQDCYALLYPLRTAWRPVPGRSKDFIVMPRPNLYQSLHRRLLRRGGHQFEVQIRTEDMHKIAEEGIAAHWKYKASDNVSAKDEAAAGVGAAVDGMAAGDVRPERVHVDAAHRPVPGRGVHVYAQGQGGGAAEGRQPDRFCLRDPHRRGARRPSERR